MTAAAMTGPTPNSPVRLVPAARTAAASLLPGLADLDVDAAQVLGELGGELPAGCLHRPRRRDRFQDARGPAGGDLPGDAAGRSARTAPGAAGRPPGCGPGPGPGSAWTRSSAPRRDRRAGPRGPRPERSAATATERASLGSFLLMSPVASSRTRAASLGGTSSTRSPAASSCWASRWPTPPAPSTAQARCGHACAHASSRSGLSRAGAHPQLAQRLLGGADRHRSVRGLVRVDPDHHRHHATPLLLSVDAAERDRGGHAQFQG